MKSKGTIALAPKAAVRPRFTCRGRFAVAYTDRKYREWLDGAAELLHDVPTPEGWDRAAPMIIRACFLVLKPKTSKLLYPKPDLDNYEKALLDSVTQSKVLWDDDCQVVDTQTSKRFTTDEARVGVHFEVEILPTEDLNDLPPWLAL